MLQNALNGIDTAGRLGSRTPGGSLRHREPAQIDVQTRNSLNCSATTATPPDCWHARDERLEERPDHGRWRLARLEETTASTRTITRSTGAAHELGSADWRYQDPQAARLAPEKNSPGAGWILP